MIPKGKYKHRFDDPNGIACGVEESALDQVVNSLLRPVVRQVRWAEIFGWRWQFRGWTLDFLSDRGRM